MNQDFIHQVIGYETQAGQVKYFPVNNVHQNSFPGRKKTAKKRIDNIATRARTTNHNFFEQLQCPKQ
jgi:hypothetical protein